MAYLLDTNACVDYLTGRYPRVVANTAKSERVKGLKVENWRQ